MSLPWPCFLPLPPFLWWPPFLAARAGEGKSPAKVRPPRSRVRRRRVVSSPRARARASKRSESIVASGNRLGAAVEAGRQDGGESPASVEVLLGRTIQRDEPYVKSG